MSRAARINLVVLAFFAAAAWTAPAWAAQKKSKAKMDKSSMGDSMKGSEKADVADEVGVLLDGFEANDWVPSSAEGAAIRTNYVPGKFGKALSIDYDIKNNQQWVAVIKDLPVPSIDRKAIQFYVKHSGDKKNKLEVKLIDEDGTNYGYKADLKPNSDWEKITLDATDFVYWWGGNPKLDTIKQFGFAVSPEEGGIGSVLIDELRLVPSKNRLTEKIKVGLVDDCESTKGWKSESDQGATASLNTWFGKEKDSLVLKYDLGTGNWVQMYKMQPLEITPKTVISFWMKWTGEANAVEFKIADFDRSNFGKKFETLSNPDQWQEINIPVSELAYLYGGDKELDGKSVIGIWIAVTKVKGSKGTLAIDSIKLQ